MLDARMLPPSQDAVHDITAEYLAVHLPNAPFFDIEALSDHNSPYPQMPRAERFAVGPVTLPEGEFEAAFDEAHVKRLTNVLLISHEDSAQIVDARAANHFNTEVDEAASGPASRPYSQQL